MTGVLIKTSRSEEIEVNWRLKEYLSALEISFQTGLGGTAYPFRRRRPSECGSGACDRLKSEPSNACRKPPSCSIPTLAPGGATRSWTARLESSLAHDLGIPLRTSAAASAAVTGRVRRIPLGRIEYHDFNDKPAHRYFTVAAGIGVDAHLFYKLNRDLMKKGGMAAYYLKAWNLWATHRMRRFEVEYANGSGMKTRAALTELLAVRIRFFGNILRELVPGAHLDCPDLRAVMCRTDSRTAYLRYITGALLGRRWNVDGIDLVSCSEIVCKLPEPTKVDTDGKNKDRVYVEADGELLGRLPARMTMLPDALSLVVPAKEN